ncbi:MAG: hypothetical protein NZ937_09810 [Armatimonadetes bacterium]|nr:hypothetical protein [Armatimonadota bacterium]
MPNKPKRLEDIPPRIQELLKRKGWTYPPDEKLKQQWKEAWERLRGRGKADLELLEEIYREMGWAWIERAKKLPRRS